MHTKIIFATLLILVLAQGCVHRGERDVLSEVKIYYLHQIEQTDSLAKELKESIRGDRGKAASQNLFKKARLAYKKTEFLTEYYFPLTARAINGAPIPSMEDDDQHRINQPSGFQTIEPYLFPDEDPSQKKELESFVNILISDLHRLKTMAAEREMGEPQVFDAMRLEVFRVITMGIAGFDAPVAQNSMEEAAAALSSLAFVYRLYETPLSRKDKALFASTVKVLNNGIRYLRTNRDFNSFDRMAFITRFGNPSSALIYRSARLLGMAPLSFRRPLRSDAETLFESEAFDPDYYTASMDARSTKEKVALGKRLFYDPVLSGNGKRSCATCHDPSKAFTDGLPKSPTISGNRFVRRNTPTVLNAGLQSALFYDNRATYLEDQATDVISNKDEMHGSLPDAVERLKRDANYSSLFKAAFPGPGEPVSDYHLRNAIGSYIRSLTSLNSPFDKYVRGDKSQLTAGEVRGFNLYMGKAKCGTCHFAPLFNGNVPPDFTETETEVIGVPLSASSGKIDTDKGKYDLRKLELYRDAFRTPTVRNIALTAPYMHNGIYKTLEEVLDFYNKGGGSGLGISLANQTLPFDHLQLSPREQKDIIAFLKKLSDTSAVGR